MLHSKEKAVGPFMILEITILDLFTLLFVGAGILAALIIAILLIVEKSNTDKANRVLAALLILSSLTLIDLIIDFTNLNALNRNLFFLPLRYTLAIGPLLYYYVRFSLFPSHRFKLIDTLHLVLPLAQALFYLWLGFRTYAFKTKIWLNVIRPYGEWEDIAFTLGLPSYVLLSFLLIQSYKRLNPKAKHQLRWMNRLLFIIALVIAVNIIYEAFDYSFTLGFAPNWCCPSWFFAPQMFFFGLLLFWMAFNGYIHIRFMRLSDANPKKKPQRKETYNLQEKQITELGEKLEYLMVQKQPFLNPDLSLASLAGDLDISTKALSLVINETQAKSYNDYVNHYRIEYLKQQFLNPESQSISLLELAFDAGFNSKATFNRVFKQITGLTPSEYRKQGL